MKIFVCIKQVPDTETKIKLAGDQIDPAGIKWVMNPYDEYAVEEAIKIREKNAGAQVLVVTAGPKTRASEVLRTALAMGADDGILIDAPAGLEPLATARALAKVIEQEGGAQLVLTGKLAIDDNASSVSQMLAEFLNIPHVTVVSKLTWEGDFLVCEREAEGGAHEIVQTQKPAVIAANKGLNMPRYASLPGIMKAKKKVLKELTLDSLGVATTGKTKILKLELPAEKPAVKMLPTTGGVAQQTATLVQLLRDEAKVL
jgi:electron transfer flavoprotein beta subunit